MGVLLAFVAGRFFVVQKCPTRCKQFTISGSCWLNASSLPSHCKNRSYKALPHVQMHSKEDRCPSLEYHCLLQFEAHRKRCLSQSVVSAALHCFGPWNVSVLLHCSNLLLQRSFNLPVLQGGGYWAAIAPLKGTFTWVVPVWTERRDFTWSKLFHILTSQLYLRNKQLLIILVSVMRIITWLNHKHDSWQNT